MMRLGDESITRPGRGADNDRQNQRYGCLLAEESGESVGENNRRDATYEARLQYSLFCVSVSATCWYVETALLQVDT
jgi:hypothetical protein